MAVFELVIEIGDNVTCLMHYELSNESTNSHWVGLT